MLFNEPKLLKYDLDGYVVNYLRGFSALQRAEIAEIQSRILNDLLPTRFSALQRAEIAEIHLTNTPLNPALRVSVLFNEPKLLKQNAINSWRSVGLFQCSSTSRNC